jgi:hypothetical protein
VHAAAHKQTKQTAAPSQLKRDYSFLAAQRCPPRLQAATPNGEHHTFAWKIGFITQLQVAVHFRIDMGNGSVQTCLNTCPRFTSP